MKVAFRYLVLVALLFVSIPLSAQQEVVVPTEEEILSNTLNTSSPYYYTNLLLKYRSGAESLTAEEYFYLYYGYFYSDEYRPFVENRAFDDLMDVMSGLNPSEPTVGQLELIVERGVASGDVVVAISAAGNAAYVVGAIESAKALGAVTVGLSCNPDTKILRAADMAIFTDTGAEILTGSTRLKAGTAQKIVLNTLTTCAMAKTGKVYENMMINLRPSNQKLKERMIRIVCEIKGCDENTAEQRLEKSDWKIKDAVEL